MVKKMTPGEEDFLVDLIARLMGWGCAWLIFLGLVVCTVSTIVIGLKITA